MRTTEDIPAGFFFILCTPLLPFDELERWTAGREHDRSRPAHLAHLLHRPDVREALYLASPLLASSPLTPHPDTGRRDADGASDEERRIESTLVRHLVRTATATTPVGLTSGFSVGESGPRTRLELEGRTSHSRRTRLDADDLSVVALALADDSRLRSHLCYRPNTSLYPVGDHLRYYAGRPEDGLRLYDLVAVEADGVLTEVLERADREGGATLEELARPLLDRQIGDEGDDDALTAAQVEKFLGELIDAQLLVPELLVPPVTGVEPLDALIADLETLPPAGPVSSSAAASARLKRLRAVLAELDGDGRGTDRASNPEASLEAHHRVADGLRELAGGAGGPEGEGRSRKTISGRLHVNLVKPARARLGPGVLAELERAVGLLDRLPREPIKPLLAHFAARFRERWGEGWELPLTEVLDEDAGIGFGLGRDQLEALADGAHLRQPPPSWLLEKVDRALEEGRPEVEIPEAELEAAPHHPVAGGDPPLADAFHLRARLAAPSSEAVAEGRFQLHLLGLAGPSGARLLGRLCHADEALRRQVEAHLRAEEALNPDAVFAEIVHLPEGRPGNGVTRPRLRTWEIPFLGRGGADAHHRLPIGDLRVSVHDGRIVLRSARLGCRVLPRQTASHFIGGSHQPLYRFLGALQDEGVRGGWSWHWGSLHDEPFLPRVRSGRLVLTVVRWRIPVSELDELATLRGETRNRAVHRWRGERRLPRRVVFDDPEGEWMVDLDHPRLVDAFLARVEELLPEDEMPRPPQVTLTELFPHPDELCVRGPEGRFLHELIVPWVRAAPRISDPD